MKTPEEIKEWLEKNEIYEKYKINVLSNSREKRGQERYIDCKAGVYTISGAFSWRESIEGEEYWEEINDMFISWYYQKESDNQETHGRKNDVIDDKLR